jgi:hypothetical protein
VNIFEVNKTADKVIKKFDYNYDRNLGTSIVQSLFVSSAYALTRYFNWVTRIVNGNGTMTLENVKCCYYKGFQVARDADVDGNKIR